MMRIVNRQERNRERKHTDISYQVEDAASAQADEIYHPWMQAANVAAAPKVSLRIADSEDTPTVQQPEIRVHIRGPVVKNTVVSGKVQPKVESTLELKKETKIETKLTSMLEAHQEPKFETKIEMQSMNLPASSKVSVSEPQNLIPQSSINAITHPNPTTQLLLCSKVIVHRPEAGLNPIVDAAAHLFSVMGRLKHLKTHQHLDKLQKELMQDIEDFIETIQSYNYNADYMPEYLLVTRYALCVTLDDIIMSTPWGGLGRWSKHNLVAAFEQEPLSHQNFLIILERMVRDPDIYIDLMEFMYICLSLGFKCHYNSSQFDHEQLEHISNALYKRIRAYRGNFSKILSPFAVRPPQASPMVSFWRNLPVWSIALLAGVVTIVLLAGGKILLDRSFKHVSQSLTQTELVPYAKTNQSVK